ncbi:hypothetical protein FHS89_002586 [Rubricella aquisinus]|jgi:hypothetical protein|uniref:Uncharacterized protein n=1 Tax=Rubricella aquisinus TaxID=2028108 RepID=A0A840X3Y9_9RHOB|nr:hypothetical protein [Rubricella aquisinus]MBB5516555.1 hypothetical protein [Rubricella aquisinus]
MNTSAALWIGGIILAVLAADHFYFEWDLVIWFMKQLILLMNWLAFWR